MKVKYKIGYTQGTFDMFHIGHLNLLENAKKQCETLIVGVNSDELVRQYKKKTPVIPQNQRLRIVQAIRFVDCAFITTTLDKNEVCKENSVNAVFIGDDWKGNDRWLSTEKELNSMGIDLIFLKHTDGISSTSLRTVEKQKVDDQ